MRQLSITLESHSEGLPERMNGIILEQIALLKDLPVTVVHN